jgi:hypothetical protein
MMMKLDTYLTRGPKGCECDVCGNTDEEWSVYVCYDHEHDDEEYLLCSYCIDGGDGEDWQDLAVRRAESGYAQ